MSEFETEDLDLPIPHRRFEEYSPRFKNHFSFERGKPGVLTAKWHTNGGIMQWGRGIHGGIGQLCQDVGQDPEIEVFILGGTGASYTGGFRKSLGTLGRTAEDRYDLEYYDGCRSVEALVGLEQATIGVINGSGYHTEYAMMCDITLIAEGAKISEPHYVADRVPGDGAQIIWREAMGMKRYNHAVLTHQVLTAEQALEYGMVNEIVPAERIYDRALEIARQIQEVPRLVRLLTTQVLRAPLRKALLEELRPAFAFEMFAVCGQRGKFDKVAAQQLFDRLGIKLS